MPKYNVTVSYHYSFEKELEIYARDEGSAEEKAVEIVEGWNNVKDVEVTDIEEG